ncbi:MAG: hypothetical protein SFX74_06445, partial [Fimbriimonadaceae bacterium]|nr:hypothetical protein [Fimbriimonadaceae bacterium]
MLGPRGLGAYRYDPFAADAEWLGEAESSGEPWLVPGFVDVHFHGAFGIDFMAGDRHDLEVLAGRLGAVGYDAVLLTTVTASQAAVTRAVSRIPALEMYRYGYHLEGPFISPVYPGAQPS